MTPQSTSVTVSAPGKLLLAGGYLVLESPNVGVVIAVNKRFYTTAKITRGDNLKDLPITVRSPQFGQNWKYSFNRQDCTLTPDASNSCSNDFCEKTLRVSLMYLAKAEKVNDVSEIDLTIPADNEFYSLVPHLEERNLNRTLQQALTLPAFLPAAKEKETGKIYKTGLGSSACLVTSVVGALCHSLGISSNGMIFNLAQISHCHAQGKVGSGFDVSAACNGSHVYQRFPKEVLKDLLAILDKEKASTDDIQSLLSSAVESTWEGGVKAPLRILQQGSNSLLQVTMADVSGGSESPSMARTVLAWKKQYEGQEKIPHWDDLIKTNERIVDLLQQIVSLPPIRNEEKKSLTVCSTEAEWKDKNELLSNLREACRDSRRHLKAMGEAAGVPIEPDEQTALADATQALPGVIAALIPGAGGYDALACLHINDEKVRLNIGEMWAGWSEAKVCPLTVQAGDFGDGVRVESCLPAST